MVPRTSFWNERLNIRQLITADVMFIAILLSASPLFANPLTTVGAEQAGNVGNNIPVYSAEPVAMPKDWQPGEHYADPFPQDPVLYKVSANNMAQYKDKLSRGQQLLLKRYPARTLPVYRSRRSARHPEFILEGTRYNQQHARLTSSGSGIADFRQGFPFPRLSKRSETAALQTLWNHMTRYRGGSVERTVMQATVFEDGEYVPIKLKQRFSRTNSAYNTQASNNILFYYLDRIVSPARLSGNTLLVHETLDQEKEPRRAWLYNSGYKRVQRVPGAGYDTPIPGSFGLKVADAHDMFNGSPDRYQWQYLGKQEMLIPYNAYRLCDSTLKYDDILHRNSINSQHMRWELHRVHVLEANLKPDARHIYGKRLLYLDEDSWSVVLAEHYDQRGQLWRISEGHLILYYDRLLPFYAMEVTYDLQSNRYLVFGLSNEESSSYSFKKKFSPADFTPAALRRASRG